MTPSPGPIRPGRILGWLALPAFLAVLALVALAASTEHRPEFEGRLEQESAGQGGGGGQESLDTGQDPSFDQGDPITEALGGDPGDVEGEAKRITIAGENGDIIVELEDGRVGLRPVEGDEAIDLEADDLVAIRLNEDGSLEVVPIDEIGPDDTVVTAADDGFDLERPDGSTVEFRADGENDGISATEIDPNGRSAELVPNQDGSVTLSDGTTVGPIDRAEELGTFESFIERASGLPWRWIALGLVLLALACIALAYHLHRRRPGDEFDIGALIRPDVPDDQFEGFLARLADDRDPTRAVRIGFSVAERGLGGMPPRHDQETPFEWQARVESERPGFGPSVGTLCDLFARARFAPGHSTEDDRRTMIDTLRDLHRIDRSKGPAGQQPDRVGAARR